jgi:hypothetical protein
MRELTFGFPQNPHAPPNGTTSFSSTTESFDMVRGKILLDVGSGASVTLGPGGALSVVVVA